MKKFRIAFVELNNKPDKNLNHLDTCSFFSHLSNGL